MAKHQRGNISTKLLVSWVSHLLPDHHNLLVFLRWPCGQAWKCKAQQERACLYVQPKQHRDSSRTGHYAGILPQNYCYSTHFTVSCSILNPGIFLCKGLPSSSHLHAHTGPRPVARLCKNLPPFLSKFLRYLWDCQWIFCQRPLLAQGLDEELVKVS